MYDTNKNINIEFLRKTVGSSDSSLDISRLLSSIDTGINLRRNVLHKNVNKQGPNWSTRKWRINQKNPHFTFPFITLGSSGYQHEAYRFLFFFCFCSYSFFVLVLLHFPSCIPPINKLKNLGYTNLKFENWNIVLWYRKI